MYFFFSSRRRHTRWPRDWSSDVCSSDLIVGPLGEVSSSPERHNMGMSAQALPVCPSVKQKLLPLCHRIRVALLLKVNTACGLIGFKNMGEVRVVKHVAHHGLVGRSRHGER